MRARLPATPFGSRARCEDRRRPRVAHVPIESSRNPAARICAYGVYAPLNESWLRSLGVDEVLGGEFEEELTDDLAAARATRIDEYVAMPM